MYGHVLIYANCWLCNAAEHENEYLSIFFMLNMKAILGKIIKALKFLIPYSFSVVFDCSTLISFVSQVFANIVVHLKTEMDIPDATQSDILWN